MVFILMISKSVGELLFNRTLTLLSSCAASCALSPTGDRAKIYSGISVITPQLNWIDSLDVFEHLLDSFQFDIEAVDIPEIGIPGKIDSAVYNAISDLRSSSSAGRGKAITVVSNIFRIEDEIETLSDSTPSYLDWLEEFGISDIRILDLPFDPENSTFALNRTRSPAYANLTNHVKLAENFENLEQYTSFLVPCGEPDEPEASKTTLMITAIIASLALLVLILASLLALSWRHRAKILRRMRLANLQLNHLSQRRSDSERPELRSYSVVFPKAEAIDHWELSRDRLHISYIHKLGAGAFCDVFRASLTGRSQGENLRMADSFCNGYVAVKTPHEFSSDAAMEDFIREIDFMKGIGYHRHVINLIGCVTIGRPMYLVMEYCAKGDLLHFLKKNRDTLKVADGMVYLSSKGYIHRDLAARNILLENDLTAKIADYGMCRRMQGEVYTTQGGRLPIKWMALESLETFEYSTKSDVWSFAVVLFEIFSLGEIPFGCIEPAEMAAHLKSGARLSKPILCSDPLYELMQNCWLEHPEDRPGFESVRRKITELLELETAEYGYLQLCP